MILLVEHLILMRTTTEPEPTDWQDTEEPPRRQRLAWALTGSGHDFVECLELMRELGEMDVEARALTVAKPCAKISPPSLVTPQRIAKRAKCAAGW